MTDFLETKIIPLVEALSSWEGIETFSSCEGHGSERFPHVTFTCKAKETLLEISKRIRETSWRIVLHDMSLSEGEFHYTLRYTPGDTLFASLQEMQKEIPTIAETLTKETSKAEDIDRSFRDNRF